MGIGLDDPMPDHGGSRPDFRTDRMGQDPRITEELLNFVRGQLREANQMSASKEDYRNRINRLSGYLRNHFGFDASQIVDMYKGSLGSSINSEAWHSKNLLRAGMDTAAGGYGGPSGKEFGGWHSPLLDSDTGNVGAARRVGSYLQEPPEPPGARRSGWYSPLLDSDTGNVGAARRVGSYLQEPAGARRSNWQSDALDHLAQENP